MNKRRGRVGNGSRWAQISVAARQRAKLAVEEPLISKVAMPSSGAAQEQEEEDKSTMKRRHYDPTDVQVRYRVYVQ